MHRSYRHIWRTPSAPRAAVVHDLLQRHANSPVIEQGCTCTTRRRDSRTHSLSSDPGRTAPSIWPNLICDNDQTTAGESAMSELGSIEAIASCAVTLSGWASSSSTAL